MLVMQVLDFLKTEDTGDCKSVKALIEEIVDPSNTKFVPFTMAKSPKFTEIKHTEKQPVAVPIPKIEDTEFSKDAKVKTLKEIGKKRIKKEALIKEYISTREEIASEDLPRGNSKKTKGCKLEKIIVTHDENLI